MEEKQKMVAVLEIGGVMELNFRPIQDWIAVRRDDEEERSAGGIIIPDNAKEKPIKGEVVAIGNGRVLEDGTVRPLDIKVGDKILFNKYCGSEVKIEDETYVWMREDDVFGVF